MRTRRNRRSHIGRLLLAVLLGTTVGWLGGCESQVLPRAIGVGEILVVDFPDSELSRGSAAEFALQLNLPEGRYEITFGIDPPGIEADPGVAGEERVPTAVEVTAQGALLVEEEPSTDDRVSVSSRLVRDGEAAVGVVRSWGLAVDTVDLYTGNRERIVEEVFPYRVQWR
jgi:hypothetical protein